MLSPEDEWLVIRRVSARKGCAVVHEAGHERNAPTETRKRRMTRWPRLRFAAAMAFASRGRASFCPLLISDRAILIGLPEAALALGSVKSS